MKYLKTYEKLFDDIKKVKKGDIVYCAIEPYKSQDPELKHSPKYGRKYKVLDRRINEKGDFLTVEDLETKEKLYRWNIVYFLTPDDFEIFKMKHDTDKYNV